MKPYHEEPGITIYHGDCRDVLPHLGPVDLVLTDPPFSVPVKYYDVEGHFPRSWGDLVVMEPFFREVFLLIQRATKPSGQIYFHCDANTYPVFYKVAYPIWPRSQMIVWYKPTGRRGTGWLHSHELILHCASTETEYAQKFNQDVIGIMPVRTLDRQHPAEKPGRLLHFLMEACPLQDPLILDPFIGSGTTLVAAKQVGRRAIGIEIEERYCELAVKRLAQGMLPLAEGPVPAGAAALPLFGGQS